MPLRPGDAHLQPACLQGAPATKARPPKSNGNGLEDKAAWALEVSLDVETAHSIAPSGEHPPRHHADRGDLGVQGLPQMMNAEDYVAKNHARFRSPVTIVA